MDILNKPIKSLSFLDVVSFCKEGVPEGPQVDYKKDFPKKGFAKHFAAMSNARGGVIIIGVEEDKVSGLPSAWEGIAKDAKQIEKIHQEAGNVEPIPSYDVHTTDEVEGKSFVLIRVYEGDRTPYRPQNDSNVWVRTGNVSNPIDIASPDGLELLFGKKEKAEKVRGLYLSRAKAIFQAGIEREEKKRMIEYERMQSAGTEQTVTENPIGSHIALLTIELQPFFPHRAIVSPNDIKERLNEIRFRQGRTEYPAYSLPFESIPDGIFNFSAGLRDGYISCDQYSGHGLIFCSQDVLSADGEMKKIFLTRIASKLLAVLHITKNYCNTFGYQGSLKGSISLEGAKDANFIQIVPTGWNVYDRESVSFLSDYSWDLDLDTRILNNPELFKEYYISHIQEIYWSIGFGSVGNDLIEAFITQNGYSF